TPSAALPTAASTASRSAPKGTRLRPASHSSSANARNATIPAPATATRARTAKNKRLPGVDMGATSLRAPTGRTLPPPLLQPVADPVPERLAADHHGLGDALVLVESHDK